MSKKKKTNPRLVLAKQERAAEREKTAKTKKKYIIAGVSLGVLAVAVIVMAVTLPLVKISSDLKDIFKTAGEMNNPKLVITDMKTDSNYSGAKGEMSVEDLPSVAKLLEDIEVLAADFGYDRRDPSTIGAWDIRLKFVDGDKTATVYLAEDNIYYVKNNVRYIFTPDNDNVAKEYTEYYENIVKLVK